MKPPASGREEYSDKIIPGLRMRVGVSGVKTFIVRKRVGRKIVNVTLGRYSPRFKLADARKKARDLLVDVEAGREPTVSHPTQRKGGGPANSVRAMVETYLAAEVRGKKRSAREVERILVRYVLPVIGDRLADSITRADVTKLIDRVVNANPDKPARAMARGVFAQLSAFYGWAMPRLDRLPANPCRDAGRPAPSKSRDRVLTDDEIRAFWRACEGMEYPFGAGFRLLLLTAQRRSEVFEAARDEFRDEQWLIPAERAKNGVAHIVPLSARAKAIVGAVPVIDDSPLLFPSRGDAATSASGFSKAKARLDAAMARELDIEAVKPWVLHDLRRTAATGLQRLGIGLAAVEAVLNHISGSRSGIAGVYQRHHFTAEKRQALDLWAAEVARIVGEPTSGDGNVIPIRRA
jgi:integrase